MSADGRGAGATAGSQCAPARPPPLGCPPPHILLKRTSTGTAASCSAERTDSSWTQDEETWVGLAASITNWRRRRESGGVGVPEGGAAPGQARIGAQRGEIAPPGRNQGAAQPPAAERGPVPATGCPSPRTHPRGHGSAQGGRRAPATTGCPLGHHRPAGAGYGCGIPVRVRGAGAAAAHQESAALAVVAGPDGAHAAAQLPDRHLPRQPQVGQVGAHLRGQAARLGEAAHRSPSAAPGLPAGSRSPPGPAYRGQRGRGLAQLRDPLLGAQLCRGLRTRRRLGRGRGRGSRGPPPRPAPPRRR